MSIPFIILGIVVVLIVYAIMIYNGFVKSRVQVNGAWSDIDVQMKRRYNLIPNLVETVKGYANHEAGTLEKLTQARTAALSNEGSPQDQAQSENVLTGALKSVFAVAEAYPELKANENFLSLQEDLAEVEEQIQAARRYYNGSVREMNTKVDQFPGNIIARRFNFTKAEFFELDEADGAARQPVAVSFD
ncbi:MAG: LemA family protein [Alphaproteobacteria bacterium]|nr:LemA family protein [Alphaproteobacteria bacterium]